VVEAAGAVVVVVVGAAVVAVVDAAEVEPDDAAAGVVSVVAVVPVVDVDVEVEEPVVAVDAWWVVAPATATPIPAAATVAVRPMATVARRMRTRAASRERVASFFWRCSGGSAIAAPFVQVAGGWGLASFDGVITPDPGQSTLDAT
jgi:hypothetical protein